MRVRIVATFSIACSLIVAPGPGTAARAQGASTRGLHHFDFLVGEWQVRHRIKKAPNQAWTEFDGTASNRPLMHGQANVEEHVFNRPSGITYGMALRSYDISSGQ